MTDPDPMEDRQERAAWLLEHLRTDLGIEFEVVSHPEAPVGLKLSWPDEIPEGAKEPIGHQVALHRHEIVDLLLQGADDPTRADDERTGRGPGGSRDE